MSSSSSVLRNSVKASRLNVHTHTHTHTHTHSLISSCFCTQFKSVCSALLLSHYSTTSHTHTSPHTLLWCGRVCASYLLLNTPSRYIAPLPLSHTIILLSLQLQGVSLAKTRTFSPLQPTGSTSCSPAAPPPLATRFCQLHSSAGQGGLM